MGRLLVADGGVNPVKGGSRDREIIASVLDGPGFKCTDRYSSLRIRRKVTLSNRSKPGTKFDTVDGVAATSKGEGCLTGATPYLQNLSAVWKVREGNDIIEQGLGIAWTCLIIQQGHLIKGGTSLIMVSHHTYAPYSGSRRIRCLHRQFECRGAY